MVESGDMFGPDGLRGDRDGSGRYRPCLSPCDTPDRAGSGRLCPPRAAERLGTQREFRMGLNKSECQWQPKPAHLGREISGAADVLLLMAPGRFALEAVSEATGVLARTRREAARLRLTGRLPHAVLPTRTAGWLIRGPFSSRRRRRRPPHRAIRPSAHPLETWRLPPRAASAGVSAGCGWAATYETRPPPPATIGRNTVNAR